MRIIVEKISLSVERSRSHWAEGRFGGITVNPVGFSTSSCYVMDESLTSFGEMPSCDHTTLLYGTWVWLNKLSYLTLNNIMTLKSVLEVTQDHSKWYHSKALVRFPICIP